MMAERRMFSSKIVCSDAFTEMPFSAQALYYQLNMEADDDGFLNNAKRIQRTILASDNDLNLLLEKRFILGFQNGVVVIKHWRMNNQIRKDRYTPTQYQDEFNSLDIKPDGAYTEKLNEEAVDTLATTWQPDDNQNGNQMATQYRLGKDSIGKERIEKDRVDYQLIADMYNETCVSFPRLKSLSDSRKKAIKARLNTYSVDDFKALFEKAEASDFLNGKNDRNWSATFDWLIKDSNMAKVLEGQYENKPQRASGRKEVVPAWMNKPNRFHNYQQRDTDYDKLTAENDPLMEQAIRTAANDKSIRERAEALKKQFAE